MKFNRYEYPLKHLDAEGKTVKYTGSYTIKVSSDTPDRHHEPGEKLVDTFDYPID